MTCRSSAIFSTVNGGCCCGCCVKATHRPPAASTVMPARIHKALVISSTSREVGYTRLCMKVALDATPLTEPTGGIRRYTIELARALAQYAPQDEDKLTPAQSYHHP